MNFNKSEIAKGILMAVGVAGVLVVAVTAPNLLSALSKTHSSFKKCKKTQVQRSLSKLKMNRLLKVRYEEDRTIIELTKKGQKRLLKYKIEDLRIARQKTWDKKWRVVIFDIPEKYKRARDEFSFKLRSMGFTPLQKSVLVCPYPCEDEINFLKEVYLISPFVNTMLVEQLDREDELQTFFNLP